MELLIHAEASDSKNLIANLDRKEYNLQTKEMDIGCGADWPFISLVIGGVSTLFFIGAEIEKNLDAWEKIGKRIKKIFKKKKKNTHIFIDKDVAIALAINSIRKKAKRIKSIELIMDKELSRGGLDTLYKDREKNELSSAPYNFYILVFNVNKYDKYLYCIKSNGDIKYKDIFCDEWQYFSYDWDTIDERKNY